jgi:uncharacterized membrane protein YraQ (UPF0718 family)
MQQMDGALSAPITERRVSRLEVASLIIFLLIAVGGLTLAKWYPYILKGSAAAAHHKLGSSIISGSKAHSPKGWHAALDYAVSYGKSIWLALTVGLLLAAGIQELVPRDWLLRVLGPTRLRSTFMAGALAVPSMMCTCCAAPPTVAMARARTSAAATVAYWLGNPVLNPATVVFMGLVLGWRWAALRIVVGIVLVFGAAFIVQRFFAGAEPPEAAVNAVVDATTDRPGSLARRYVTTLARLCISLLPEYAVIVLALGAARAFLFPAISPSAGHALWLVLLLAVTGTLMVIPTAGEIPIVQSFMRFGLSAAGGGALMITLPAISLPSLAMVSTAIPRRTLVFLLGWVMAFGLITAALAAGLGL